MAESEPRRVIGGRAFANAPTLPSPYAADNDGEDDWGCDPSGDPLSYEAWLAAHRTNP
jgi:hypothetical protein